MRIRNTALFVQYYSADLPPLRSHCGEAPPRAEIRTRDSGIETGTLTTSCLDHHTSIYWENFERLFCVHKGTLS